MDLPETLQTLLESLPDAKRADAEVLIALLSEVSGNAPHDGGSGQIGFGTYHYVYESGREGDSFRIGLAPKKNKLTLYIMDGFEGRDALMQRLGKHKATTCCLHINKLADVDLEVVRELATASVAEMNRRYPVS